MFWSRGGGGGTHRRVAGQKITLEVNFFMFSLKVGRYWLLCILVLVPMSCPLMRTLSTCLPKEQIKLRMSSSTSPILRGFVRFWTGRQEIAQHLGKIVNLDTLFYGKSRLRCYSATGKTVNTWNVRNVISVQSRVRNPLARPQSVYCCLRGKNCVGFRFSG